MNTLVPLLLFAVLFFAAGCADHLVKPAAFDEAVLKREPLPGGALKARGGRERSIEPGIQWMEGVDPLPRLVFVGYRKSADDLVFCLVLTCDPKTDELTLLPLKEGETPLDVLASPTRRTSLSSISRDDAPQELIKLSLTQAVAEQRLGPPLPTPRHIFAVGANYPSHLEHDLAIRGAAKLRSRLSGARARVFLKYPPVPPPGKSPVEGPPPPGFTGPYDDIDYPTRVRLPAEDSGAKSIDTVARLDYEVEVGAVIGRHLSSSAIIEMSDEDILESIAGYVLMSDVKFRNPQVVDKIAEQDQPLPDDSDPYQFGDETLDRAMGFWDQTTCHWWSYAASWGTYAAAGPFFVAAPNGSKMPSRAMIAARSYGHPNVRGQAPPAGRSARLLYLRQCTITTDNADYPDRLIWTVPQVVRSILAEGRNALAFRGTTPPLEPGDVICLGTPGGTVITSKPQKDVNFLDAVLFWWTPRDFHDAFFDRDAALYLLPGDEVFFWAEGLGYQQHQIRSTGDENQRPS